MSSNDPAISSAVGEGAQAGPQVQFEDIFSLRRPKDARAGLSSGLKSIAKGVMGGVAGLVAAPVIGASQQGVTGFAKGVATGVVGAVVLPVTGVGVGVAQMVRGAAAQPEAWVQTAQGKVWCEERREWLPKPDGSIVAASASKQRRNPRSLSRPTSGDDYYAILQVPKDAPPELIKKQYYLLARKWHPDKNPGDATAHERFQKLGEAYQVLSNDELRRKYDEHGSDGLDVNFMDGGEFFNMLFGSDQFEHLIGELLMAAVAKSGGDVSQLEMKRSQQTRVEKLATNLKVMLKRYAQDEEGFQHAMRAEAQQLVNASFGDTLLLTIGKVYEAQADILGGGFLEGTLARFRHQGDTMKSQYQAASAAIKVYAAQQKIEAWQREQEHKAERAAADAAKAAKEAAGKPGLVGAAVAGCHKDVESVTPATGAAPSAGGEDAAGGSGAAGSIDDGKAAAAKRALEAERAKMEEAALPLMLEAMWAANVLDIQGTLRLVCACVLKEEGVAKADLATRAKGLKLLGTIFQDVAVSWQAANAAPAAPPAGAAATQEAQYTDARRRMEEAMFKVVEKRTQQDGRSEED